MYFFNNTTCCIAACVCLSRNVFGVAEARSWNRNRLRANGIDAHDVERRGARGISVVVSLEKIENLLRNLERCRAVVLIAISSVSDPPLDATRSTAMFEFRPRSFPLALAFSWCTFEMRSRGCKAEHRTLIPVTPVRLKHTKDSVRCGSNAMAADEVNS